MERFVVIVRTVQDLSEDEALAYAGLPTSYPVDCAEFESLDEAQEQFPGKTFMPATEYLGYSRAMSELFEEIQANKKPSLLKRLAFWKKTGAKG